MQNPNQAKRPIIRAILSPFDRQERKVLCSGIAILIQAALADRMFDWLENPAIAAKCQRMVLKRVNSKWESTRIPSSCSIINNPEEEAVKVCKEVTNREKSFVLTLAQP